MNDMGIGYSLVNLSMRMTTSMPKKQYLVALNDDEREHLGHLLHGGTHATRQVTRARMLRKAAEGWEESAIAAALSVGRATVERTRQRCGEEGLKALEERPRPGTQPKLDAKAAARLSAEPGSAAPEGRQRWTLHRLAARVGARGLAASYASERVRRVLKKRPSNRGGRSEGVSPQCVRRSSPRWQTSWRSTPSRMLPHDQRSTLMRPTSRSSKRPGTRGLPNQGGRSAMLTKTSATARATSGSSLHHRLAGGMSR